jgi:septal ring factor EnvC (AmiA/AmiB activator)
LDTFSKNEFPSFSDYTNNTARGPYTDDYHSVGNKPQQQQQQMDLLMENDVNLAQLREREDALKRLENDIVDVNMIFKDLAVMVHDQGSIIDSIESNVEQTQARVQSGNVNLESARKNQVIQQKTNQNESKLKIFIFFLLGFIIRIHCYLNYSFLDKSSQEEVYLNIDTQQCSSSYSGSHHFECSTVEELIN